MKTNAIRLLERLGIDFEVRTHEVPKEHATAEQVAALVGLPAAQVFKTLVTRVHPGGVVVACVPGSAELDPKALSRAAGGKHAALVGLEEVQPLTGYLRGGCSPLGMKRTYPTFVDRSAEEWPFIAVNGGARGCQICVPPQALLEATGARLASIARPRPACAGAALPSRSRRGR